MESVVWACLIIVTVVYLLKRPKSLPKASELYEEYETAPSINEKWTDSEAVGLCGICGCDDSPVFWSSMSHLFRCKWCSERQNLESHLHYNGQRRLRKRK